MTILNWCIENGFELVELKPDPSDEEEEEGLFRNKNKYIFYTI